jgi:hypothetical protein
VEVLFEIRCGGFVGTGMTTSFAGCSQSRGWLLGSFISVSTKSWLPVQLNHRAGFLSAAPTSSRFSFSMLSLNQSNALYGSPTCFCTATSPFAVARVSGTLVRILPPHDGADGQQLGLRVLFQSGRLKLDTGRTSIFSNFLETKSGSISSSFRARYSCS